MKATAGEELISALATLRALFPDWRMGQLVANLVTAAAGRNARHLDVADEQLLAAARHLIEQQALDIQAEWLALAERRMLDVKAGKAVGVPAEEVLNNLL